VHAASDAAVWSAITIIIITIIIITIIITRTLNNVRPRPAAGIAAMRSAEKAPPATIRTTIAGHPDRHRTALSPWWKPRAWLKCTYPPRRW